MSIFLNNRLTECEGIIYKLANKYKNYYNFDDLYQAGCIGIIKADKNYSENENCKFSSYAYKYILGEMVDFIRKDKNIIISDELYNLYKKYIKVKELLYSKYEREVSFDEICKYMEIDKTYLLNIIESVSFAKSIEEDEKITNNFYLDNRSEIDTEILLKSELEHLEENEKSLINYRYYEGYSQSETALKMGISQAKVSREEKLILKKIKDNMTF